ncbi:hypothetical protein [Massilia scottii]|uniref:hypothetical protein n=1 Tax=Massilia scottii TaxID=3057166 RepID=UPI0027969BBF|nr:hypothetical protein [Massilia sp. CCM 9029]MDQ1833651.1 hypothetical protein [Massilia sp. CCM 9029]
MAMPVRFLLPQPCRSLAAALPQPNPNPQPQPQPPPPPPQQPPPPPQPPPDSIGPIRRTVCTNKRCRRGACRFLPALPTVSAWTLNRFCHKPTFSTYFLVHWAKNRIFQGLENPCRRH